MRVHEPRVGGLGTETAKSHFSCNLVVQWAMVTRTNLWPDFMIDANGFTQSSSLVILPVLLPVPHILQVLLATCTVHGQKPCAIYQEPLKGMFPYGLFIPTYWKIKAHLKIIKPDLILWMLCVPKLNKNARNLNRIAIRTSVPWSRLESSLKPGFMIAQINCPFFSGKVKLKQNWTMAIVPNSHSGPNPVPILPIFEDFPSLEPNEHPLSEPSWLEHPHLDVTMQCCVLLCVHTDISVTSPFLIE